MSLTEKAAFIGLLCAAAVGLTLAVIFAPDRMPAAETQASIRTDCRKVTICEIP